MKFDPGVNSVIKAYYYSCPVNGKASTEIRNGQGCGMSCHRRVFDWACQFLCFKIFVSSSYIFHQVFLSSCPRIWQCIRDVDRFLSAEPKVENVTCRCVRAKQCCLRAVAGCPSSPVLLAFMWNLRLWESHFKGSICTTYLISTFQSTDLGIFILSW